MLASREACGNRGRYVTQLCILYTTHHVLILLILLMNGSNKTILYLSYKHAISVCILLLGQDFSLVDSGTG